MMRRGFWIRGPSRLGGDEGGRAQMRAWNEIKCSKPKASPPHPSVSFPLFPPSLAAPAPTSPGCE